MSAPGSPPPRKKFPQPSVPRAISFVDGQNLHKASKYLWGYTKVNYDPKKLSEHVCSSKNWQLIETRLYTGIPRYIHPATGKEDTRRVFWDNKIKSMKNNGIVVYTRELQYARENGVWFEREKGIDVRIAIDVAMSIVFNRCDVALIFSQDQDFNELSREIRSQSHHLLRWIKIASAFPCDESTAGCGGKINTRGIDGTDWCTISRAEYDACIDGNCY